MPTTIQTGGNTKESTLDKILKGIAVANQGLGIYSNIQSIRTSGQQQDLNKLKLAETERQNRGEFTPQEYAKLGFDVSPIVAGAPEMKSYKESPIVKNGRNVSPLIEVPVLRGKIVQPDGSVAEVNLINREAVEKARDKGWKELSFDQKDREIEAQRINKETARADAKAESKAKVVEKGVGDLSERLEKSGLTELGPVAERLAKSLKFDTKDFDIPGYGQTATAPEALLSKEGKEARQAVGALRNMILKARSGGAVTDPEANRLLEELGEGVTRTDEQLRSGVQGVLKQLAARAKTIQAGVPPESIAEFEARGGTVPKLSAGTEAPAFDPASAAAEILKKRAGAKGK